MSSEHLVELAHRIDFPERLKWVYLGAYNMTLHLAVYQDGNVLVVAGGDRYSVELRDLGFSKSRGEWVRSGHQYTSAEFRLKFPSCTSFETSCADVLIDRTDEVFYITSKLAKDTKAVRPHSVNSSIIREDSDVNALPNRKDKKPSIWFAEASIGPHELRGFGLTPEEAMSALVDGWIDHCKRERIDPALLTKYSDSVSVSAADVGAGYIRGVGDSGWHSDIIPGDHERFQSVLNRIGDSEAVPGNDGHGFRP